MQRKSTNALHSAALAATVLLTGAASASAAEIGLWDFREFDTNYDPAPGPYVNYAASPLAFSSGMTNVGAGALEADTTRDSTNVALGSFGLLIGAGNLASGATPEPPAPVSTTDYLGFTVTPSSPIDLNTLTFNLGTSIGANQIVTNTNGTFDNLETNAQLFYSTDGTNFTAVGPLIESTAVSTVDAGSFTGMNPYSIDLSGLADLDVGQTAEFRIAFSDNRGGNTATMGHYLDNVSLNATLVPEPGSLALVGMAGLGLLARRRRQA